MFCFSVVFIRVAFDFHYCHCLKKNIFTSTSNIRGVLSQKMNSFKSVTYIPSLRLWQCCLIKWAYQQVRIISCSEIVTELRKTRCLTHSAPCHIFPDTLPKAEYQLLQTDSTRIHWQSLACHKGRSENHNWPTTWRLNICVRLTWVDIWRSEMRLAWLPGQFYNFSHIRKLCLVKQLDLPVITAATFDNHPHCLVSVTSRRGKHGSHGDARWSAAIRLPGHVNVQIGVKMAPFQTSRQPHTLGYSQIWIANRSPQLGLDVCSERSWGNDDRTDIWQIVTRQIRSGQHHSNRRHNVNDRQLENATNTSSNWIKCPCDRQIDDFEARN